MSKIECSIVVDRLIGEVFEFVHDPTKDPLWQASAWSRSRADAVPSWLRWRRSPRFRKRTARRRNRVSRSAWSLRRPLLLILAAAEVVLNTNVLESELHRTVGIGDYATLAWFTASLATIGGALGAGLESDEAVREAAYTSSGSDGDAQEPSQPAARLT